jgi:hypothetical protein
VPARPRVEPETLLADVDPDQREAILATSGPVAIHAGAGSRQDARHQPPDGVCDRDGRRAADQVLVVTFTDKRRDRDGGAACGARPAGRHGAHVPRATR